MAKWIDQAKLRFVRDLLKGFQLHARGQHTRERAIRALLELSQGRGGDAFVRTQALREKARYAPTVPAGIYWGIEAWVDAGVVKRQERGRDNVYKIRASFYDAVRRAL